MADRRLRLPNTFGILWNELGRLFVFLFFVVGAAVVTWLADLIFEGHTLWVALAGNHGRARRQLHGGRSSPGCARSNGRADGFWTTVLLPDRRAATPKHAARRRPAQYHLWYSVLLHVLRRTPSLILPSRHFLVAMFRNASAYDPFRSSHS